MTNKRVRVGSKYRFVPVLFDISNPPVNAKPGDIVRVVNLQGCPPANTMGMAHVAQLDGKFAGHVCTNSLQSLKQGSWQVLCWDKSDRCRKCDGRGGLRDRDELVACPYCDARGHTKPGAANAVRFATVDEAKAYGRDLFGRWTGLDHWEAAESKDPVNYIWAFEEGGYGRAVPAISIPQIKSAQTLLKRKTTFANLRTVLEKQERIGQTLALILRDGSRALVTSDEKSLEVRAL